MSKLRATMNRSCLHGARNTYGALQNQWRSLSASQDWVKPDTLEDKPQPDTEHEHGKMVSEGGGSVSSYGEAKEEVQKKSGGVVDSIKHHVEVEMNTAKDMVKDFPEKAGETKEELKDTVVVAGQALKRDAEKLAEKAGIRERKPGDLENE